MRRGIRRLFQEVFKTHSPMLAEAVQLSDALIRSQILQDPDIFLEESVRYNLEKGNFGVAYASWAARANAERTVAGCNRLFDYAFFDSPHLNTVREERISK